MVSIDRRSRETLISEAGGSAVGALALRVPGCLTLPLPAQGSHLGVLGGYLLAESLQ